MSKWTLFTNKADSQCRSCQFWINFLVKYITVYLSVMSLLWKFVQGEKSAKIPFGVHYNLFSPRGRLFWVPAVFPTPTRLPSCPSNLIWSHPRAPPSTGFYFTPCSSPHVQECDKSRPGPWGDRDRTICTVSPAFLSPPHPTPTCLSRGGWAVVYTRNSVEKERNLQEGKQVI